MGIDVLNLKTKKGTALKPEYFFLKPGDITSEP